MVTSADRELITRSLARSFCVVHQWIIQRQLFWKAKILDFNQRGVFDFVLVGEGQVNQECICPKRLRQKCNHIHVNKKMEELFKVILGRGAPGNFSQVKKDYSRWVIYVLRAIYKNSKRIILSSFIKDLNFFYFAKKKYKNFYSHIC